MYRSEETQLMIQGHITHSPDEMKEMFYDVFETGKKLGLPMSCY
jgi:2-dehydropantoate 2-reductase